jgi:hypothetical protein
MSTLNAKKYLVFHIEGGIGKNIMATAVVKAIKKQHPDREIIVVSPHSGLWMNNPHVYRIYMMGQTPYFYEDFIKNKDTLVLKSDPYLHQDYISKKAHCIEAWCDQSNVKYNGEEPEIVLTQQEIAEASGSNSTHGKPILLLQTNGGNDQGYSWVRDMPFGMADELCEKLKEQYKILHVRLENQPSIDGIDWVFSPNIRQIAALVKYSHARVLIDSFVQHAAKAFGKKSTVVWPVNKSKQLGYDLHDNIASSYEPQKTHMADYYLTDDDIVGQSHMCPFPEGKRIFDLDEILESVKKHNTASEYVPPPTQEEAQNPKDQPQSCPKC